jgi:2,3-bisphosphoglycerate-dependent phosphoglycerate mutase
MNRAKLLVFLMWLSVSCTTSEDVTTFILIRHAEKGNDGTEDPDLTDEGNARAEKLSFMFKDTPIAGIYSTNYKRTKSTVRPIAAAQNVEVEIYEALKPGVIEDMIDKHRGGTVLVSGHTNTTPWTANLLTGKESYKDYAETEYGAILIVSVRAVGEPVSVLRLNY